MVGSGSKVVVNEEEVKKKGVGGGGVSRDSLKIKLQKEAKNGNESSFSDLVGFLDSVHWCS